MPNLTGDGLLAGPLLWNKICAQTLFHHKSICQTGFISNLGLDMAELAPMRAEFNRTSTNEKQEHGRYFYRHPFVGCGIDYMNFVPANVSRSGSWLWLNKFFNSSPNPPCISASCTLLNSCRNTGDSSEQR